MGRRTKAARRATTAGTPLQTGPKTGHGQTESRTRRHVDSMNASPPEDDPQAVSEAADFLVRLADAPSDAALHAAIQSWRRRRRQNDAAWTSMVAIWHMAGDIGPVLLPLEPERVPTGHPQVMAPPFRRARPPRRRLGLAAALSLGAALLFGGNLRLAFQSDYRTGTAENRTVTLPDGSVATLGARSAIALHYTPQARQVRVLAGEVFFTVRHDAARSFIVTAGRLTARDIGTRFDIDRAETQTTLAVSEGSVGVSYGDPRSGPERRLVAGDVLTVDLHSGTMTGGRQDPAAIGSWRQGRLLVTDATVASVVGTLRRYYPGLILSYGSAIHHAHVAGNYDLSDVPGALHAVAAPARIGISQLGAYFLMIGGKQG